MAVYTPRRETSGETNPAGTWVLDFQPSDWERMNVLFKPPSLRCFITQPQQTILSSRLLWGWSYPGWAHLYSGVA